MSLSLFTVLLDTAGNSTSSNNTSQNLNMNCVPVDQTDSDRYQFYQYMMIPSLLQFIVFSYLIKRRNLCLDKCASRPGIVYPMDIYERKNRMSFIAAFGAAAYLCAEVVLNSKMIFPYSGVFAIKIFVIILSVICYGLLFFPIFAALTVRKPLGYIGGSLQIWALAYQAFNLTFGCADSMTKLNQLYLVLRDWPKLGSIIYLSIMLPVRFIFSFECSPNVPILNPKRNAVDPVCDDIETIKSSLEGRHVVNALKPKLEVVKEESEEGCCGSCGKRLKDLCHSIIAPWLYKNNPEFRYSARILSLYFVCFIIVYKISVESLVFFLPIITELIEVMYSVVGVIGWAEEAFESEDIKMARKIFMFLYYIIEGIRACFVCAIVAEMLMSSLMIFHMISSYRKNLLALFKGSRVHIPPMSEKSNASLMVGTMRYTGYQVGYILWAYIVQASLFFLVFFAIAVVVALYRAGIGGVITDLIAEFWSAPVTAILLVLVQLLMAKFLFLQDNGNKLAIENRRGFFLTVYFVFFYNTFLGLISCLMRILKAIGIGSLFLGRLDHSTLPRRFQLMDPGFDAYVGFMHMENAHYNPVMLTFISILQMKINATKAKNLDEEQELENIRDKETNRRRRKAIQNWHMACLLHFNPQFRVLRKDYLEGIREKRTITKKSEKKEKTMEDSKGSIVTIEINQKPPAYTKYSA